MKYNQVEILLTQQGAPPPETITVDKWYQPTATPRVRKALSTAIIAGSFFFGGSEAATGTAWNQPQSQPRPVKRVQNYAGEFRTEVVTPEEITLDKWYRAASTPYFSKKLSTAIQSGSTTRIDPFVVEPETATKADWPQPFVQRIVAKIRQNLGGETRTEVVVPPEVVTMDKWYLPTSQPMKQVRQTGTSFLTQVITVSVVAGNLIREALTRPRANWRIRK